MLQSDGTRQYDIPRNRGNWLTMPQSVPGRMNTDDYVFFKWNCDLPANMYCVAVESMSTASPNRSDRFRLIGMLDNTVELPDVMYSHGFGSHAKILVLPKIGNLPAFVGDLVRGSTYHINLSGNKTRSGHIILERTGVY